MSIHSIPEKTLLIYFENLADFINKNNSSSLCNYRDENLITDNSFLNVIRRAFDVDGNEITVESPTTGAEEKVELSDLTSRRQQHGGKALWIMIMKDTAYFNSLERCCEHMFTYMKIDNDDVVLIVHETNRVDDNIVRSSKAISVGYVSWLGINNGVLYTQYNPKNPKCADLVYLKTQMVDALFSHALPKHLNRTFQPNQVLNYFSNQYLNDQSQKRKSQQSSQLTNSSDLTPKIVSATK